MSYTLAHLIRECIHWYTERSGQTKITQLQLPLPVDQQILRLEIAVKDPVFMAECGPFQ